MEQNSYEKIWDILEMQLFPPFILSNLNNLWNFWIPQHPRIINCSVLVYPELQTSQQQTLGSLRKQQTKTLENTNTQKNNTLKTN